jgi:NAD(P)H-dependent flavin oxidoreductase YrpB (nitropropane dioxygenase family)
MGTRFLATKECNIHEDIKQAIVSGSENDTELLMRGSNTLRVFKNSASIEALELERQNPKDYSKLPRCVTTSACLGYTLLTACYFCSYCRYRELIQDDPKGRTRQALQGGVPEDTAIWSAGQVMGLIDDIPTCADLLDRIVTEAADSLDRAAVSISHARL